MEVFHRLLDALPKVGASDDAEEQTRAVLAPMVARIVAGLPTLSPVVEDPATCPNCGVAVASTRSPYCSAHCREMAAFVRQFRSSVADGSIFESDRQVGMGQALWAVFGGGFPRRQQMVPPKTLAKVIERDGGKCAFCGAPATEVDHAGSACNRPINLRAVCSNCNRGAKFGVPGFDLEPSIDALCNEIAARASAIRLVRCCDDAATWDWRKYLALRKQGERSPI